MRIYPAVLLACLIGGLGSGVCPGQSLQEALEDLEVGDRWQYNEWETAKAAAAKSGKPILALFR